MAHTSLFNGEAFVWLDETGTDRRDQLCKYGYALSGVTPAYQHILVRGDRHNAITVMSSSEILALEGRKGTMIW